MINITKSGSSMTKGESMRDTLLTLSAMGTDAIVIRDSSEGAAFLRTDIQPMGKSACCSECGRRAHAHPSQALLDLFTVRQAGKKIRGMKYVILGDILHSRVARSDIVGLPHWVRKSISAVPEHWFPENWSQWGL